MSFLQQLHMLQRMHRLIHLKSTGNPDNFAKKLNISRPTLYRYLEELKGFGAPIMYCKDRESFCYETDFVLKF
jgi:hypothetical protein